MPQLINEAQLDRLRKNPKQVVILDATSYSVDEHKDAHQAFQQGHIAGARFLDLNMFNDPSNDIPKMLNHDQAVLSEKVSSLGIANDSKLIFYDNSPYHTSCRALWIFKMLGHPPDHLYILNGNLASFKKYGGKIEEGEVRVPVHKPYIVHFNPTWIRTLADMKANLTTQREQVIDVRHPVRYAGGKEKRADLRSGHIPGSFSFPFFTMFDANNQWNDLQKIRRQLTGIGIVLNQPIITSCGSGTTAPILNFALDLLGQPDNSLYDGSWSEWGACKLYPGENSLDERPVETCLDN